MFKIKPNSFGNVPSKGTFLEPEEQYDIKDWLVFFVENYTAIVHFWSMKSNSCDMEDFKLFVNSSTYANILEDFLTFVGKARIYGNRSRIDHGFQTTTKCIWISTLVSTLEDVLSFVLHCVVCPSSICGFWLPLLYLQSSNYSVVGKVPPGTRKQQLRHGTIDFQNIWTSQLFIS